MKIGAIAKAAGMTTSAIRFYEKQGIIPPATRDANGYRDYPAALVTRLRLIAQAQQLGFSLKEVAAVEPGDDDHPLSCDVAIALLTAKLTAVDALITEAQDRRKRIITQIADLQRGRADR